MSNISIEMDMSSKHVHFLFWKRVHIKIKVDKTKGSPKFIDRLS